MIEAVEKISPANLISAIEELDIAFPRLRVTITVTIVTSKNISVADVLNLCSPVTNSMTFSKDILPYQQRVTFDLTIDHQTPSDVISIIRSGTTDIFSSVSMRHIPENWTNVLFKEARLSNSNIEAIITPYVISCKGQNFPAANMLTKLPRLNKIGFKN
jgi:hypothetical protein